MPRQGKKQFILPALAWYPQDIGLAVVVSDATEYEQEVGEAVEVDEDVGVDGFGVHEGDDGAFGTATDGAGEV